MAQTLLQYQKPVPAADGRTYEARACGGPMDGGGTWEGWIEFVPVDGGPPLRSPRETTQPNRTNAEYWATGLTPVYLEGALTRALEPPIAVAIPQPPQKSLFAGPAPRLAPIDLSGYESVLNPFSVYEKGEAHLRRQLGAMSSWHLVNIVRAYELSAEDPVTLARHSAADLIEIIVSSVRAEPGGPRRR